MKLIPGYNPWDQAGEAWFDADAAKSAIAFCHECVCHVEGAMAGKPFVLEPWQQAIVGNLFGWKIRDAAGRIVRRYREALIYVPRKNGKTPLAAAISSLAFFCDGERGAQCYMAAADREQATLAFRQLKGMIEQEPQLSARCAIYGGRGSTGGVKSIVLNADPASVLKVISADADTKHGGTPHFVLVDELHAQPNRDLVDVLRTSFASSNRIQPLLVYLTTADFDRPSICNEIYQFASSVRDNKGDPTQPGFAPHFLPVIYEAPRDANWRDEKVWAKCNPNLGVSVSLDFLRAESLRAQEQPAYENTFRRLHLNQRTSQDVRVVPMDKWDLCPAELNCEELVGRPCYGGLDMASIEDLASLTLVFPFEDDFVKVINLNWCPEARVVRRARAHVPYDIWANMHYTFAGRDWHYLTATAGENINHKTIFEDVQALAKIFNVKEWGCDGFGAQQLMSDMDAVGMKVVKVSPSYVQLSGPMKDTIRRIAARKMVHGGNPVLRWAASNTAAQFDGRMPAGQTMAEHLDRVPIMPSKKKSGEKIDPFTALVLAMSRLVANPQATKRSVYEERGLSSF